jgi:hypothetical protein
VLLQDVYVSPACGMRGMKITFEKFRIICSSVSFDPSTDPNKWTLYLDTFLNVATQVKD